MQLGWAKGVDQNSSGNSKARVVGGQLGDTSQQAAAVLESVLLSSLPLPFGFGGKGAAWKRKKSVCVRKKL